MTYNLESGAYDDSIQLLIEEHQKEPQKKSQTAEPKPKKPEALPETETK